MSLHTALVKTEEGKISSEKLVFFSTAFADKQTNKN